jgi:hypothetical protein
MHTIKLRGPWQIEALESQSGSLPPPTETTIPGDWGNTRGQEGRGRVRYTRRFGLPTNLEPNERVSLVIGRVDFSAAILLNGQSLGKQTRDDGEQRYDVTSRLKPRNELQIEMEMPADAHRTGRESQLGGLLGEVWLEIDTIPIESPATPALPQ